MMKLMLKEFLDSNPNWEQQLSSPPYSLIIKHDGDYVLFKYHQYASDMSLQICQEARGIIFHKPTMTPVCVPFFKFFNYGEPNAAEIDWSPGVTTTEKIDGSLMKLWYHNGCWHLSTNGLIDAYKAPVKDHDITFGECFEQSLAASMSELTAAMDTGFTYMFELVHPDVEQVIHYEDASKVYFLAQRDMQTYEEIKPSAPLPGTVRPKEYNIVNMNFVFSVLKSMDDQHEGMVVCDKNFNRVKVKTQVYLMKAYAYNNGVITDRRIISMFRADVLDDFLRYIPEKSDRIQEIMRLLNNYAQRQEALYKEVRDIPVRKELVRTVKERNGDLNYVIARLNGRIDAPMDYFHHYLFESNVLDILNSEQMKSEH